MKATGIVRRVDELGRVVIPKEIRRTLKIKDGDPLEIYIDKYAVVLKKYTQETADSWHKVCSEYMEDMRLRAYAYNVRFIYQDGVTTCIGRDSETNRKIVGLSYLNRDEDKDDPIIGQAIAYCRALNGKDCDYMNIIGLEG
jgi:stage V sporulation protein T